MTDHRRWTQTDITDLRAQVLAGERCERIADAARRRPEDVRLMMIRLRLREIASI